MTHIVHLRKLTESLQEQASNLYRIAQTYFGQTQAELAKPTITFLEECLETCLGKDVFSQIKNDDFISHHFHLVAEKGNHALHLSWSLLANLNKNWHFTAGFSDSLEAYSMPQKSVLRVLVMIAAPNGVARLNFEQEEAQIKKAFLPLLNSRQIELEFTIDGTLTDLKRLLSKKQYHVLHFSGHGNYNTIANDVQLAFEDPDNGFRVQATPSSDFVRTLAQATYKPQLVVMSACESALADVLPFKLLQAGIPAVVAMNHPVIDSSASEFAAALYQNITNNRPFLMAFQEALEALENLGMAKELPILKNQWLIPQLFLSQNIDKPLFEVEELIASRNVDKHQDLLIIGRRHEYRQIYPQFLDRKPIYIKGLGGVGKTTFANFLLDRFRLAHSKAEIFEFNETNLSVINLVERLRTYLGIRQTIEGDTMTQWQILLQELQHKSQAEQIPFVFLFDNIESFQNTETEGLTDATLEAMLRHLFDKQLAQCLITGRYTLPFLATALDLHTVDLQDFSLKCSLLTGIELLPEAERQTFIETLHKRIGGHYRTLEFVSEILVKNQQAGKNLVETLAETSEEALLKSNQNLVFEQLISYLSPAALYYLYIFGFFNAPVLPKALIMQLGEPIDTHDLTKLYDLTLLTQHEIEEKKGVYANAYYAEPLVKELYQIYYTQHPQHYPAFDHTLAGDYFSDLPKISDWLEATYHYELALPIDAWRPEAQKNFGYITGELGYYFHTVSAYESSLYFSEKSLKIRQQIGDQRGEGTTLNNISQIYDAKGDYDTALDYLKKSLKIRQQIGDLSGEGTTLNNISQIYDAKGDYDTALDYLKKSLKIRQQIGDQRGEGTTLNNISQIYSAKGDYDTALDYLKKSLKIQQQIGDLSGEGTTLNNLATTAYAKGDYDTALDYLKKSLKIQQQIGDQRGEGTTLNNLATTAYAKGDYDTALDYLKKSLKIQQQIGDLSGEGTTLNNISQIYDAKGDYDTALDYLKKSLKIQQQIGDQRGEGTTLNNISQIYSAKGDYDTALDYLKKSLKIQQQIGDIAGLATTLNNMGAIYFEQKNEIEIAVSCFWQAFAIFKQISSPNIQTPSSYLGAIIEQIGDAEFQAVLAKIANNAQQNK